MKWHGAWFYGVHRTHQEGCSFMWHQPCQHFKDTTSKTRYKKLVTHVEAHVSTVSAWERRIVLYKSDQQQHCSSPHFCQASVSFCIQAFVFCSSFGLSRECSVTACFISRYVMGKHLQLFWKKSIFLADHKLSDNFLFCSCSNHFFKHDLKKSWL